MKAFPNSLQTLQLLPEVLGQCVTMQSHRAQIDLDKKTAFPILLIIYISFNSVKFSLLIDIHAFTVYNKKERFLFFGKFSFVQSINNYS